MSDGEPSDSGREFGSECGSVVVSGVPVVTDVGETALSVVTVMCEGVPRDSEWDFVEPQSFSFSKKRKFVCVENQEDMNYEGTLVKAPPCPERRMRTPLPQQSSFLSMEEGSPWSAQERTAVVGSSKTAEFLAKEPKTCQRGKNWRIEWEKRRITLNEFELEGSTAQRGLWNLAREREGCRTEALCPGKKVM